jgi:hypothetical protein
MEVPMSRRRKQPSRKTSRVTPPAAKPQDRIVAPQLFDSLTIPTHQVASQPEGAALPPASAETSNVDTLRPSREHHTLAFHATGNAGTVLQEAHQLVAARRPIDSDDPAAYREAIERRTAEMRRAAELEQLAWELRVVERDAAVQRRRIERAQASLTRAAEREAKRADGTLYIDETRRPNRPCHAEVDPAVWQVLKSEAVRRRETIGVLAGRAVAAAAARPLPRHALDVPSPSARQRFVRLTGVDATTWQAFRVRASDAGVTVGDALGAVFAAEARRIGHRA